MRPSVIATAALTITASAGAGAQCDDWQLVSSPNPTGVIDILSEADAGPDALYAYLIADDSLDIGNPVDAHALRRDADGWTDLGVPPLGDLEESPIYLALGAANVDDGLWLGGAVEYDPVLIAPPLATYHAPGGWLEPEPIDLANQVIYPFFDRGGRIRAIDVAPDGTVFAVGLAKPFGLTNDHTIPLFLVHDEDGWHEIADPETDWPGVNEGVATSLDSVVAFSADDVWAVGRHPGGDGLTSGGLVVHWDGEELSIVEDPRDGGIFLGFPLRDMDAIAPDDIWAVGGAEDGMQATAALAHYDGDDWSLVPSPYAETTTLTNVVMNDDGSAWASPLVANTQAAYYDGSDWTLTPPVAPDVYVSDMARAPDGRLWSLGFTAGDNDSAALVLDCDCSADFNGDGTLDLLDFIAFQEAFVAGDEAADCDDSDSLDVLDFVCYQTLFQAGCP